MWCSPGQRANERGPARTWQSLKPHWAASDQSIHRWSVLQTAKQVTQQPYSHPTSMVSVATDPWPTHPFLPSKHPELVGLGAG
jgi:hypothetical protein